jgi:hypothetical protein
MKQYLTSSVVVLLVIAAALVAFGQQSERQQRGAQFRQKFLQRQTSAVETILEQAGKMKTDLDEMVTSLGRRTDPSKNEGFNFREEWGKKFEEWQETREVIEQQLWKLTPPSQLRAEHNESIAELQFIHEQAVEEKAEKTAKYLEELIAKRSKEFGDTMKKLGFPASRQSR